MIQKHHVEVLDYAQTILGAIPKGVLLTTKAGEKVNTMTIGWGTLGTNWSLPVFVAYVRKHRSTVALLDANPEFTINVPVGTADRSALNICGSKRGDEVDKIALAKLTLVASDVVRVPGIAEFPLTLECKVVYRQAEELALFTPELLRHYPQDVESCATGSNKDEHIAFYGKIVNAYLIEA